MAWIAGVDGCKGGWVVAMRDLATGALTCEVAERFEALVEGRRRFEHIAVDIPIGLPDSSDRPRECDALARLALRGRASSVFPAPIRAVLESGSYEEANDVSRANGAKGLNRQSHGLVSKIREVDEVVRRAGAGCLIREAHPELAFVRMNGGVPLRYSKHHGFGLIERRRLLRRVYPRRLARLERLAARLRGVALDDLYDALAVLETARRIAAGQERRLPDRPPLDRNGIPMEIVY